MEDRKYQKITLDILPIVTPEQFQSPKPPPVPTELQQFKYNLIRYLFEIRTHFDKECMLALYTNLDINDIDMPELTLEYCGEKVSLPMHAQLYDDFIEFLNQQINNERQ